MGSLKGIKITSPTQTVRDSFRVEPTIKSLGKPIEKTIDGKKILIIRRNDM